MVKGFTTKTDYRLIKEAIEKLIETGNASGIQLRDLHEKCNQSSKHKTVRQFASIMRLKAERYEFRIDGKETHLVGWREGPLRFYALDYHISEKSPMAAQQQKNRRRKATKETIEI